MASSHHSAAHLFSELLEGTCDLDIGLNCGSLMLSPEAEQVSDSFKTLIPCSDHPLSPLLCLVKILLEVLLFVGLFCSSFSEGTKRFSLKY